MQKRPFHYFFITIIIVISLASTLQYAHANDLINVNTATSAQLVTVKGIGKKTAAKIIEYRKDNGDFTSIEDLIFVKGIGPKKMEKFRKALTVSGDTEE